MDDLTGSFCLIHIIDVKHGVLTPSTQQDSSIPTWMDVQAQRQTDLEGIRYDCFLRGPSKAMAVQQPANCISFTLSPLSRHLSFSQPQKPRPFFSPSPSRTSDTRPPPSLGASSSSPPPLPTRPSSLPRTLRPPTR